MSDKINTTKPMPKGGPLSSTLEDMKEYNMNVLNDTIDSSKGK